MRLPHILLLLVALASTTNAIRNRYAPDDPLPEPVVETTLGRIRGESHPVPPPIAHIDMVARFIGIPFAAPPVGDLRWRKPVAHAPWSGVRNTTSYGNACLASHKLFVDSMADVTDEDCLMLNIWAPTEDDGVTFKKNLPVLVYIHGGGFMVGSSSHPSVSIDPSNLVPHHEAVYVSFNYRLGALGFLAHPGMTKETGGLFGIYDQLLALKFVQDNIAAFGGDPNQVTVQGSSAGAISICLMMVMDDAAGLFQRTIMQSPLCAHPFPTLSEAHTLARRLANQTGCHSSDLVAEYDCLKQQDGDAVAKAMTGRRGMMFYKGTLWFPVINGDDSELPKHPAALVDAGHVMDVPTIVGTNRDEGSLFLFLGFPFRFKLQWLEAIMNETNGVESTAKILQEYEEQAAVRIPGDYLDWDVGTLVLNDLWTCAHHDFSSRLATQLSNLHVYEFSQFPAFLSWPLSSLGVLHGVELRYTHAKLDGMSAADIRAVNHVLGAWRSFIHGKDIADSWPVYTAEEHTVLRFEGGMKTAKRGRLDICDSWDTLMTAGRLPMIPEMEEPLESKFWNVLVYKSLLSIAGLGKKGGLVLLGGVLLGGWFLWPVITCRRSHAAVGSSKKRD